jgi:hypothetical protein
VSPLCPLQGSRDGDNPVVRSGEFSVVDEDRFSPQSGSAFAECGILPQSQREPSSCARRSLTRPLRRLCAPSRAAFAKATAPLTPASPAVAPGGRRREEGKARKSSYYTPPKAPVNETTLSAASAPAARGNQALPLAHYAKKPLFRALCEPISPFRHPKYGTGAKYIVRGYVSGRFRAV